MSVLRRTSHRRLVRIAVFAVLCLALGSVIVLTWQSIINGLGTHLVKLLAAGWVS